VLLALEADVTLNALASGGAWYGPADDGTAFPIVSVAQRGSPRRDYTQGADGYDVYTYIVKAITSRDADGAEAIAARIHTLLHRQPLTVTGRTHMATLYQTNVSYPETIDGVTYWHEGGVYDVWVS